MAARDGGMLNVAILGTGRMGRELAAALAGRRDARLAAAWLHRDERPAWLPPAVLATTDLDAVLGAADVAVDFTLPAATPEVLDAVARTATPLVCGVTGQGGEVADHVRETAARVPLLFDRNMSYGIAVMKELAACAAKRLGVEFAVEIHEKHHVHKKDAPSGTALALGEAVAEARGVAFAEVYRYPPQGAGAGGPGELLFRVEREGEVAGEHRVVFDSSAERLVLVHAVTDRRVFAEGALKAAAWLVRQPPGHYRMANVLRPGHPGGGGTGPGSVK